MRLAFLALMLTGCASSRAHNTASSAQTVGVEAELARLRERAQEDSTSFRRWRDLGSAYFALNRLDDAIPILRQAAQLNPHDGPTLIRLAALEERAGNLESALAHYERCAISENISFEELKYAKTRALVLSRELMRLRAHALVGQPGSPQDDVVAVYQFTSTDTAMPYRVIGRGIAAMLITDLKKVRNLTLVERLELAALVEEIRGSQGGDFDDKARVSVGRMIGAESSVSGSIVRIDEHRVRLNYFVLNNRKKEPPRNVQKTSGELTEILKLQKEITYGILKQLGVKLSGAEKEEIGRIPTTSAAAFIAYCEGLDLYDRGLYSAAYGKFAESQALDPAFSAAAEQAALLEGVTEASAGGDPVDFLAGLDPGIEPAAELPAETATEGEVHAPIDGRFVAADEAMGMGDVSPSHDATSPVPSIRPGGTIRLRFRFR